MNNDTQLSYKLNVDQIYIDVVGNEWKYVGEVKYNVHLPSNHCFILVYNRYKSLLNEGVKYYFSEELERNVISFDGLSDVIYIHVITLKQKLNFL
jgi:hypothetical protein